MKDNRPDDACDDARANPFESCKFEREPEPADYAHEHQERETDFIERDTRGERRAAREAEEFHSATPTHTAAGTPLEDAYTSNYKPSKAKYIVLLAVVILVFACYKIAEHMFAAHQSAVQLQEQLTKVIQQDQTKPQIDLQALDQAVDEYTQQQEQQVEQSLLDKLLPLENLSQLTVLSDLQYLTSLTVLAEYYSDYSLNELHRKLFLLERLHQRLPEMREVTTRLYQEMGQNYNWLTKFASAIVGHAVNVDSKDAFPYLIDQLDCFTNLTNPQLVEDSVREAFAQGTFLVGDTHNQWILQKRQQPRAIQFELGEQKFYGILYEAHQSASAHYDIALDHEKDSLYPAEFRDYLTHQLTKNDVTLEFRLTCPQHPPKPAQ